MSISLRSREPARFLITVILAGLACGKAGDQRSAAGSESASAAVAAADTVNSTSDSTLSRDAAQQDTNPTRPNPSSSPVRSSDTSAQTSSMAKTPNARSKVRPNIDPGRISTKPKSSTAARPVAVSDSNGGSSASTQTPASSSSASSVSSAGQKDSVLSYDAASNTVTFHLIGGPAGFQFNGYSSGGATLTLPPKANVVINFINKDGTPHSAEVIPGEGAIPNSGGDPALPKAYTNQLLQGLPQEGTDNMRFTVPASGSYRIFCGVPGHGLSGMWIWMKVDPAAKTPSFGPTKS